MSAKEHIKILMAKENITMKELAMLLSEKSGKNISLSNFSAKLNKGYLRFEDAEAIAEILGYEIQFVKKGQASENIS